LKKEFDKSINWYKVCNMKLILSKACSARGADMGRPNRLPQDVNAPIKLRMERLKWVDQDYDENGAYWGHGTGDTNVYCAWNEAGVRIFTRGWHRESAKQGVWKVLPNAKFFH
jgi:hypothetical protein